MMGRMIVIGTPMARVNSLEVSCSFGAQATIAPVVSTAAIPRLASSQSPERVSKVLRSSTATSRASGMCLGAVDRSAAARRGVAAPAPDCA
jgi:hypothetical protein